MGSFAISGLIASLFVSLLTAPHFFFSISEDGWLLPKKFCEQVGPKKVTRFGYIFSSTMCIIASFFDISILLESTSLGFMLSYFSACVGLIETRYDGCKYPVIRRILLGYFALASIMLGYEVLILCYYREYVCYA